ncbi:MAG: hypothetical protein Q4F05_09950 [bacterium]|nr:hypothetical protein [bacterium]
MKKVITILGSVILLCLLGIGSFKLYTFYNQNKMAIKLTIDGKTYNLTTSRITIIRASASTGDVIGVKEITDVNSINKIVNACIEHEDAFKEEDLVNTWNTVTIDFHNGTAMGIVTSNLEGEITDNYDSSQGMLSMHSLKVPNELVDTVKSLY